MNILEKLKSLDQSKISSPSIIEHINSALEFTNDQLTEAERSSYDKLYDKAFKQIADADEKVRVQAEKEAEQEAERVRQEQEAAQRAEQAKKQKTIIESMKAPHLEYLESQGKSISSLPKDIKQKHLGWNLLFAKLKKNPDNAALQTQVMQVSENVLTLIKANEGKAAAEQQAKIDAENATKAEAERIESERVAKEQADLQAVAQQAAAEKESKTTVFDIDNFGFF